MKLEKETIREISGKAQDDVSRALKTQQRFGRSDETVIPYGASAELVAAVGEEEADRLAYRAYDAVGDLLHNRDEFANLADSAMRDLTNAVEHVKGGSARFNSLGILQSSGPRLDVLAATFGLRFEAAVRAWMDVLCAVEEARQEDAEGLAQAAQTIAEERERARRESQKKHAAAQKEQKAKLEKECEAHTQGSSSWHGGAKCSKKAKKVAVLEDGSTFRFCGTHLRSAVYGDRSLEPGDTFYAKGKGRVKVTAIEDFAA